MANIGEARTNRCESPELLVARRGCAIRPVFYISATGYGWAQFDSGRFPSSDGETEDLAGRNDQYACRRASDNRGRRADARGDGGQASLGAGRSAADFTRHA